MTDIRDRSLDALPTPTARRRYPAYRPSGIEWLGGIPMHWVMKRLKALASEDRYTFVDGPFGSDLKNEDYQESGVPLIQLNNIADGKHIIQHLKFVTEEKASTMFKHLVYPGQIVMPKMAEPVARAAEVSDKFKKYLTQARGHCTFPSSSSLSCS